MTYIRKWDVIETPTFPLRALRYYLNKGSWRDLSGTSTIVELYFLITSFGSIRFVMLIT